MTSNHLCVGIKVFPEPCRLDENENISAELEEHVDRCVEKALSRREKTTGLKFCDIKDTDLHLSTSRVSSETIINSHKIGNYCDSTLLCHFILTMKLYLYILHRDASKIAAENRKHVHQIGPITD